MHSHEVMREVLKKTSAKQIAADMALSLSLIYKWAEPPEEDSGSGASSPLERVGQLIRISGDTRVAQWVCEQADGFFIRNPHNLPPTLNVIPATNDIVQEFADMLATIAKASADSVISKDEARTIRRRWEELKSVTEGFVKAAENGSFAPLKATGDEKSDAAS
ncbi:phage regulatory CII family protein [Horticoccus sp. 23ND18S-11]|uniref:phage regulatory CII family protein n=1 Tax=Horticoccus sp. 23ND18S-11 TaxID=3391832 RepID=UPI0039C8CB25